MKAQGLSNWVERVGVYWMKKWKRVDLRGRKEDRTSDFEGDTSEMSVRYVTGDDQQATGYPLQERNLGQAYKWGNHQYTNISMREHRGRKKVKEKRIPSCESALSTKLSCTNLRNYYHCQHWVQYFLHPSICFANLCCLSLYARHYARAWG